MRRSSPAGRAPTTFESPGSTGKSGKLDFPLKDSAAYRGLLSESVFPDWHNGSPRQAAEDLAEMQKNDPLATQIWKLYSKTKSQLPNQERMANLTWRMMAMSLKRQEKERQERRERAEQQRYVILRSEASSSMFSPLDWITFPHSGPE